MYLALVTVRREADYSRHRTDVEDRQNHRLGFVLFVLVGGGSGPGCRRYRRDGLEARGVGGAVGELLQFLGEKPGVKV